MKFLKKPTHFVIAFFLFIVLVIFSCKKETSQTLSPQDEQEANMAASESDAEAEDVFNGLFDDVMGVNSDVGIGVYWLLMNLANHYEASGIDSRTNNTNPYPAV